MEWVASFHTSINLSRVERNNDNFEKISILIYKNNKRKTFVIKEK